MSALDKQEGGSHYKLAIQPIEYIAANELDYFQGNVIKYITRHKGKNGAEDCELLLLYQYSDEVFD